MNQLPVSERRGEPYGTSLHGSTVGYKPDPCGSVSLGLCSSNLGMYSTMDTMEDTFVTPKRQSNSQFRQMISEQVGQLLFNSPLTVCYCQIQNNICVEENKDHDVRKSVNRKHRRHYSMRENKRKHCRASYSPHEHVTGKCQPETQETYSREYLSALSQEHIYEEIPDISDEQTRLDEGFLNDSSLSTVHPHNKIICKNLGERTPCDGQESSPVQQRKQRTSSVQSRCTVRKLNRSLSVKEGQTRRQKQLYLESDVTVPDDENDVIQGQRPVGEGQRSNSTRKMLQKRLKNFSKKLKKISSIKTLSSI